MTESRLFTAYYRSALFGKVKSWHATVFENGNVEQLVELLIEDPATSEAKLVQRAFYSSLSPDAAEGLRRAVSSRIFHDLEDHYETPDGLMHYRELNSGRVAEGRHRVATSGACSLAKSGETDMIIFMGIWEKIRSALPLMVEEPSSDSQRTILEAF